MGHHITAIILKGDFDKIKAADFDLIAKGLGFELTLFHVDHYYSAYWQHKLESSGQLEISNVDNFLFPSEIALAEIMRKVSHNKDPEYAIIQTEYFGGKGKQHANVFKGYLNIDKNISTINQALRYLGVTAVSNIDEFETVGLDKIRQQPDFLDKYIDLAEENGK
ncbi:MAG: hypothetical protein H7Z76_11865 [Methylotenera sp.]|nr:hypothetical protein [Flavobacterium sp.]